MAKFHHILFKETSLFENDKLMDKFFYPMCCVSPFEEEELQALYMIYNCKVDTETLTSGRILKTTYKVVEVYDKSSHELSAQLENIPESEEYKRISTENDFLKNEIRHLKMKLKQC